MTDRPTPEQIVRRACQDMGIADTFGQAAIGTILKELRANGYVILHPDDLSPLEPLPETAGAYLRGVWFGIAELRREIFGEGS